MGSNDLGEPVSISTRPMEEKEGGLYHLVASDEKSACRITIPVDGAQVLCQPCILELRLLIFIVLVVIAILLLLFFLFCLSPVRARGYLATRRSPFPVAIIPAFVPSDIFALVLRGTAVGGARRDIGWIVSARRVAPPARGFFCHLVRQGRCGDVFLIIRKDTRLWQATQSSPGRGGQGAVEDLWSSELEFPSALKSRGTSLLTSGPNDPVCSESDAAPPPLDFR